ncbi:hypothetical protein C2845_PM08G11660 [Panicum miliaceum]|uniref:Uncharacterized protein n=1 Tax=Panicum miliaceum TaxID=4540 RepID=A0A3L6R2G0_PANMI|nr:hypothetical protein C2845_PM08G11660 [Panicum miliaceum]
MEVEYHEVRGPRPAHCGRLLVGFLVLFSPGDFLPDFLLRVCSWLGRRGLDRTEQEYVRNSRGVQLFTCGWLPAAAAPKALVFLCHGYGMECSVFMRAIDEFTCTASYFLVHPVAYLFNALPSALANLDLSDLPATGP